MELQFTFNGGRLEIVEYFSYSGVVSPLVAIKSCF